MKDNESRLKRELIEFDKNINIHSLPDIFHYWSNKHLKQIVDEYNITHTDEFYVNYILDSVDACETDNPIFLSIGSGNCDTEVRIAKQLLLKGMREFCIECIDLNLSMLERGQEHANKEGVSNYMSFIELDLNFWKADKIYTSIIANQSLHHIYNLEGVFAEIKKSLHKYGTFITIDIIGRNGHMRWPEALYAIDKFWRELPESYKYNHVLSRHEPIYDNWDCSSEAYEGIRAQDILPLLIKNFNFELFIAYSNVIDVFIDRGFGHNFDANNKWDTDFIDKVHEFDENSIRLGKIKPTHMISVMRLHSVKTPKFSRGLSPEFCVRSYSLMHSYCEFCLYYRRVFYPNMLWYLSRIKRKLLKIIKIK